MDYKLPTINDLRTFLRAGCEIRLMKPPENFDAIQGYVLGWTPQGNLAIRQDDDKPLYFSPNTKVVMWEAAHWVQDADAYYHQNGYLLYPPTSSLITGDRE